MFEALIPEPDDCCLFNLEPCRSGGLLTPSRLGAKMGHEVTDSERTAVDWAWGKGLTVPDGRPVRKPKARGPGSGSWTAVHGASS